MRDLKNKLTSSKNTKNIQNRRGKSFGYQVLGFGAGDSGPAILDYLVIAGGGSGGAGDGCGAGAGGYLTGFEDYVESTTYTVTIGSGGSGVSGVGAKRPGNQGSNSVLSGGGLSLTSIGGGFGGCGDAPGQAGGNGGSGGGGTGGAGSGTVGQGFDGSPNGNSGGGGASEAGKGPSDSPAKAGGDGLPSSITGSAVTRAGGGGGYNSPGGAGGGGNGGTPGSNSQAGDPNTGGGSGGSDNPANSSNGGSGVVILSMPDSSYSGTTTGSPTVATGVSGRTVLTFTGSGTYVS